MSSGVLGADDLRRVRNLDDVMAMLASKLEWPITAENLEDATFEFTAEELGLAPDALPELGRLRQLRPLSVDQPWGIFFLEFSGPRLRVGPLRRLLQAFVTKRRISSDDSHRRWGLEDLLFVVATDSGANIELHLVAFFDEGNSVPEIRSVPWRPEQSPDRHLQRVVEELLPHLMWPDDTDEADAWRREWREAFKLRHGDVIQSAARLAERMAETAKIIRREIEIALASDEGQSDFRALLQEVRTELVADVDEKRFSDMCAQTLVYGMLTSRITDPDDFGASPVLVGIPLANPFLSAFFEQVHDQVVQLALENAELDDLVADLRVSNVEAILDQFGATAHGGDPVIHFYEHFLALYDPDLRIQAGAFYTPLPVVRFMVSAVASVLEKRFGLSEGLSDPSTWREVSDHLGVEVPINVDPDSAFISMLDPATGTGTFLVEWIRQAHEGFLHEFPSGDWQARLSETVLPSMHGFELMLAPYAIAHLKVALESHGHGAKGAANAILLTDTLEHPSSQESLAVNEDPVAVEGQRAAKLKNGSRFTVCIGNPPYDREQKTIGSAGKRKGGIVRYGVGGIPALLEDISEPMRRAGLGGHVKNIYNDYVYFWRWATWQTTERIPGPGVVSFITASSYLDGVSMGGLREHLRARFDELWIIDLGGDSRGAMSEENVFDIRTPVAIAIGVCTIGGDDCDVRYTRISGDRVAKLGWLSSHDLETAEWVPVEGVGMDSFLPLGTGLYWSWVELTELFPWIHSGSQLKRTWPIGPSTNVLAMRWHALQELEGEELKIAFRETRDRKTASSLTGLLNSHEELRPIDRCEEWEACTRYGYRSFDRQWVIADNRLMDFPRRSLWKSSGPEQIFLTTLTSTNLGKGPVVVATPYVPDMHHFSGRGAKNVIPCFRDAAGLAPNVTDGVCSVLSGEIGCEVSPQELFSYVYGLTATSAFSEKFGPELAQRSGPVRVPLTSDSNLFAQVVTLGNELLYLHTWGERFRNGPHSVKIPCVTLETRPLSEYPNTFQYDSATQTLNVGNGAFSPVSDEVWDFEVSGLRVIRSWLGYRMADRKGRKSSPLDDISPSEWSFTDELLELLTIVQRTVDLGPRSAELLQLVVTGPLIPTALLPQPTEAERKSPKS